MSQSQETGTTMSDSVPSSETRYPVKLVNHRNIYARTLVDVEGNILRDRTQHKLLNVYREEMNDALAEKRLRVIRNSTMKNICYRYFVTTQKQQDVFLDDLENGSLLQGIRYHVYCDEDVDRTTPEYRKLFID